MQAQHANPLLDDLKRTDIALHRLSLVHLRCVEIAQAAEASEQGQKEEANTLAGDLLASSEEKTSYGNPSPTV